MLPVHLIRIIALPAFLLLPALNVLAQNVEFIAMAGADKMGKDNQIEIIYTVRDAENLQSIAPGKTKDFKLVAGPYYSTSSSVNIVGNHAVQSSTTSATFIFQPTNTGNLTIPPGVAVDAAGHTFQSNALNIQVIPGMISQRKRQEPQDPFAGDPFAAMIRQQQMQAQRWQQRQQQALRQQQQQQQPAAQDTKEANVDIKKDLFIKVLVDKPNVRVGEQVTATYKLYARIPMQVGISKLPLLNGFWTQDFDIPKQPTPTEEIVDGKKYQVFVLKKSALFPQQTGKLVLDAAEAQGTARIVRQVRQRNPFDMFDDPVFRQMMGGSLSMADPFFNDDMFTSMAYQDVPVHLKSQPVNVTVTSLPDTDVPADYGGAVGHFTVNAKLDKTNLTTDDAVTLTFTINGSGNLKLIQVPTLKLPNGLDSYDPQIIDTITGRSTTISGSKIITYSIAPRTSGDYTIPAIPFTYFNPQTGQYATLHTNPFKIKVTAGKNYVAPIAKANLTLKDIHSNVLNAPASFAAASMKPLVYSPGYWSLYGIPLLAFIGVVFWKRREDEENGNSATFRNKRANKIALKRLTTANQLLQKGQQVPFYEEVSRAIWLYLSDKLSIPLSALNKEIAMESLTNRKVPQDVQLKAVQVMDDCELALYAPSGGRQQMQQTYNETVAIISKLEDYLQR